MNATVKKYLTPYEAGLTQDLGNDPQFNDAWEAGAARRAVTSALMKERIRQKMSQEDLAKKAGLKQPNVARIESGKTGITIDTLGKLAKAFGKTLEIHFTTTKS